MDSLRQAAATPLPTATEEGERNIQNSHAVLSNDQSPTKRTRWDEGAQPPWLTLQDLTAALAPLTGGMVDLQKRMANMEAEFADKVGSALDLIRTVDKRQQALGE